jgi:hypothetical protein
VSDIEITPAQWRMARQAGASFQNDTESEPVPEHGQQLIFDQLGPQPGDLLRNVHSGEIACVVTMATRRKTWVTVRRSGRLTEVELSWIGEYWQPCRPDGSLR